MSKIKLSLIFLSTISIVSLLDSGVHAFNLILGGQPGGELKFSNRTSYSYVDPRKPDEVITGINTLRRVEKINIGGNSRFQQLLSDGWASGWKFNISPDALPGTVEISQYFSCGGPQRCPRRENGNPNLINNPNVDPRDYDINGVGARIDLKYTPLTQGNIPDKFGWIQRVITNHTRIPGSPNPEDGHGIPFDEIDTADGTPFYARAYGDAAYWNGGNYTFFDRPYREDSWNSHRWGAELFPVIYTSIKDSSGRHSYFEVTLYDGFKWGWDNTGQRRRRNPYPVCPASMNILCIGFYTDVIGGGIGQPIAGYTKNDDKSFGAFKLGYPFTYFDKTYDSLYINNNGNVSFGKPVGAFTAQSLLTNALAPIIAPYWADVDTRARGSIRIRTDISNQTIITWNNVGYFSQKQDRLASFQLVLRGDNYDIPPGEGNIGFFYKNIGWETGNASGGTNGFGGTPAGVGLGDGSSKVNPGEQMINGSMKAGISQLVSNNHFWFNLKSNPQPPDPCTGGSGGGGCSPKAVAALNSQRTVNKNMDYMQVLPSDDLDPAISEIIRNLQNSMLFSPNSPQSSTSSDYWMNELDTSSNNYWTDNADNYWMDDAELSDESIPLGEPEDDLKKLISVGITDPNPPDVPEPISPLMILVFGLGIAFKKWKLKEYK